MFLTSPGWVAPPPPPPPPPAVPIVDTFTAANGTNPTTRDIDSYAGIDALKRWAVNYQPGQIQSNALVGGGAWVSNTSLVVNIELNTLTVIHPMPSTWFLLFDGLTLASGSYTGGFAPAFYWNAWGDSGNSEGYFVRSSSGGTGINLGWSGNGDVGGSYFSDFPGDYAITGLGPHKFGIYFGTDTVSFILNGAVIDTTPTGVGVYNDFNGLQIEIDGSSTANSSLSRIAIFGPDDVADLAAAIALTT
jgi:hypothetical protein